MDILDLRPSCRALADLVTALDDADLDRPTPCPAYPVGDLVEHVGGLSVEFRHAAAKAPNPGGQADGDAARLPDGWRDRIADDLIAMAEAWQDPAAYEGETHAGPVTLPAREAGLVALNEVVVHGWDLAVSTGRDFAPDAVAVEACRQFVAAFDAPANGDGGLFGPPVEVPDDAPALDRLVGATGRDPAWTPPA